MHRFRLVGFRESQRMNVSTLNWVGWLLRWTARVALLLAGLASIGVATLFWRLEQRPLELPWLARQVEASANAGNGPKLLSVGGAALAWEVVSRAAGRQLCVRVTDIEVTTAAGTKLAQIPRADVSLSLGPLLLGQIVPRAIEVDGAQLRLLRTPDGNVWVASDAANSMAFNIAGLLANITNPPKTDRGAGASRWSALQLVKVRDAAVTVEDRKLDINWQAPEVNITLRRPPEGGVEGDSALTLSLNGLQTRLTLKARLPSGDKTMTLEAALGEVRPASIAAAVPQLAMLSSLDAPLVLSGSAELGADLQLVSARLHAIVGAGSLAMGHDSLPFVDVSLDAQVTPATLDASLLRLTLQPRTDGPKTTVRGRLHARHEGGSLQAAVNVDLDEIALAGLPALWPDGVGGRAARSWIAENITSGSARHGRVELKLRASEDLSDAEVTSISGGIDGNDVTVWWLRPVPPIEHGEAQVTFVSPDAIEIAVFGGKEAGGKQGGLTVRSGLVRLTGLSAQEPYADIDAKSRWSASRPAALVEQSEDPAVRWQSGRDARRFRPGDRACESPLICPSRMMCRWTLCASTQRPA